MHKMQRMNWWGLGICVLAALMGGYMGFIGGVGARKFAPSLPANVLVIGAFVGALGGLVILTLAALSLAASQQDQAMDMDLR